MTNYDVLIIGAGPAGLSAALTVASTGHHTVALIDGGRTIRKRYCPVDHGGLCNGCGGSCNVIKGFGGSIHYGDGVKLSQYPSGRRLYETIGIEDVEALTEDALSMLFRYSERPIFSYPPKSFYGIEIKRYPVAQMSGEAVSAMLDDLLARVIAEPRVSLFLSTKVIAIDPIDKEFQIAVETSRGRALPHLIAKRIIVAGGRGAEIWWHDELRRLSIAHRNSVVSIGLRFECPPGFLREAGGAHPDFKTTIFESGIKVKTFCFCAGSGGGRIKFADYGPYTLLDGHIITDGVARSENLALLVQLRDEHGIPRDRNWIQQNIVARYRAMRSDRPGKPLIQSYEDFSQRRAPLLSAANIFTQAGISPAIRDYCSGNIAMLLDKHSHTAMCSVFERLLRAFMHCEITSEIRRKVVVIGLELEGLWDELELSSGLETSVPNLYVAGDCTGLAQGILQASISGIVAARSAVS